MIHRPTVPVRALSLLIAVFLTGCSGEDAARDTGLPPGAYARLQLEAAYPEPFSFLNGVREMSDGTLLAADPLSQVVLRMDLVAGTADTLGRVGEGPQEYKQPDQVFPLPGDSTLLVDLGRTQLTVIGPDGVFHDGMRMANATEDGRVEVIMPRAVDRDGRLYFTGSRGMDQGPPDSTLVLRYDRRTQAADTMGWAWRPEPIVSRSGSSVRMMGRQMEGRDDWAVGPDGRFALVRSGDYSVEWRYPDGRVVKGPPNAVETPRIDDAEKRAYLEQRSSSGVMTMIGTSSSGAVQMSMSRGGVGMAMESNPAEYQWAERFAPFRPDRSMVSPTGELWVERWLPASRAPQMNVFDGDGGMMGTVDLPERRQLIGFGSTAEGEPAAYLVRTDEFDLKWLELYRIVR